MYAAMRKLAPTKYQGFLVYPLLLLYSQGCALLQKRRCALAWRQGRHASAHLLSDPRGHEKQFPEHRKALHKIPKPIAFSSLDAYT